MATIMTSQEALNSIFTLLSAVVQLQDDNKKESSVRVSGEDAMLISLLTGLVETNSSEQIGMTGEALEKLSKGVIAVDTVGTKTFTNVATSINVLNSALNALNVGKDVNNNIDNLIKVFEKLSKIEAKNAQNITEFINALTLQNPKAALLSVDTLHKLLVAFSTIIGLNIDEVIKQLKKLEKNKNVTAAIGNFIKELAKNTEDTKKLGKNTAKTISELLGSLSKIGSVNMWKLMFTFHPFAAKRVANTIANFVTAIVKALGENKIDKNIKYIGQLLKPLSELGSAKSEFNISLLKKSLNKDNAEVIASFFTSIVKNLPTKKLMDKLEHAGNILELLLTKLDKKHIQALIYLGKNIDPEYGTKISEFITNLCKGEVKEEQVKATTDIINTFGNLLVKTVMCFAILVLLVTIFPITSILMGMAIMYVMIQFMKKVVTDIVSELVDKDIKDASKTINAISIMMMTMTLSIAILTIVASMNTIDNLLLGIGMFIIVIASSILMIKALTSEEIKDGLNNAADAIYAISVMFIAISISIAIISAVFSNNDPSVVWQGALLIIGIVAISVGLVYLLSNIDGKELDSAVYALYAITACLTVVAIVATLLLPAIGENVGPVALGALVVLLIVGAMIGMIWMINQIDAKDLSNSLWALAALTICFTIISIVAKSILGPIGDEAGPTVIGSLVVLGIVAAMILMVKWINNIDAKDLTTSLWALAALTLMFVILAMVADSILIPIGKKAEPALYGALIVTSLIGLMVAGVWLISTLKTQDLMRGIVGVAAMAFILLAVSLITKELLIPIGQQAEPALYGAGIVVGLLTILIGGVYLISKIDTENLIKGVIAVALVAVILWGISTITKDVLIPIGQKAGDALIGAATILGILTAIGGITYFVGKRAPKMIKEIIVGGVLLTLLSGFMGLMGLMLNPFIDLCIKAGEHSETLLGGGLLIAGIIAGIGLIILGLGALGMNPLIWVALGLGAALLGAITATTLLLSGLMLVYIPIVKKLNKLSDKELDQAAVNADAMFKSILGVINAAALNPWQMIKLGWGTAGMIAMLPFIGALAVVTSAVKKMITTISKQDIDKFIEICVGKDENDPNSLIGALKTIVKRVSDFGLISAISARLIAKAINPILNTVSMFIDIIKKAATMLIITGYDKNGKPIYERLPGSVFIDAANAVSSGFSNFVTTMYDTFKDMSVWTMRANASIAKAMKPILNTVSKFVDIVIKVATLQIVKGYDKNGKPIYEQVEPAIFTEAAKAVSGGFSNFLSELSKGFEALNGTSPWVIKAIGKSMKPVMDCVAKFVDTIIKVATLQIVTGYDKNGKPIYEQLTPDDFTNAAIAVSASFGAFLIMMGDEVSKLENLSDGTIKKIGKNIGPVMNAISSFADTIIKLSTSTYSQFTGNYDNNGNPIYIEKVVTPEMLIASAVTVATTFNMFLKLLADNFESKDFRKATEKALKAIGGNIGDVMNAVADWGDVIYKLASGTITTFIRDALGKIVYDKDGKPKQIVMPITKQHYINAADALTTSFISFLTKLSTGMQTLAPLAEEVMGYMKDGIEPVMKGVKLFTDSILPFVQDEKDKDGNIVNKAMSPDKIKVVADKIAESFVSFVDIISTKLSSEEFVAKYTEASKHIPTIKKMMNNLNDGVESLSEIIKNLSDKDGNVITSGETVAGQFYLALNKFISGIEANVYDYGGTNDIWKDLINPMLKLVSKATNVLSDIIRDLGENKEINKPVVIDEFLNILVKLSTKGSEIYERISNLEFGKIVTMVQSFKSAAYVLQQISDYMLEHENLTIGIDMFIKNLQQLTSTELNQKIVLQGGTLTTYQKHLLSFTLQVENTTATVTVYVSELDKAREALIALDDQIINNEEKRNNALQSFADKVDNIANAVTNLKSAFDNLNENQILKQFENIRNFLGTINDNIDTNSNTNTNNNSNTSQPVSNKVTNNKVNNNQNKQNERNTTVVQPVQSPFMGRNIEVVFNFKDTKLEGHMFVNNR